MVGIDNACWLVPALLSRGGTGSRWQLWLALLPNPELLLYHNKREGYSKGRTLCGFKLGYFGYDSFSGISGVPLSSGKVDAVMSVIRLLISALAPRGA